MRTLTAVLCLSILTVAYATTAQARGAGNPNPQPVVFVTGQGLYYDSIVTADPLPRRGRFQKLEMTSGGLQTEYGPGDPGYIGGRWWVDINGDNIQDDGDHFFMCPLQGPGREAP